MKIIGTFLAVFLFSVVSPERAAKIYLNLESADPLHADFAMEMIASTLRDPELIDAKPGARLFIEQRAMNFLISGRSPIENEVAMYIREKADFKIIACGQAVSGVRAMMKKEKAKLIPGVQLVESCSSHRQALRNQGWFSVEVPADER